MTANRGVDEARDQLRGLLARGVAWLQADTSGAVVAWPQDRAVSADAVRKLSSRAASALLNVALLGTFSSGKSFLLNGLQGCLEVIKVERGETTVEKFVGLFPSSPTPTTACPAAIVPVAPGAGADGQSGALLRARFTDGDTWEDVGVSPAPSVVAAYAMAEADHSDRLRHHRGREVAEIEVLLERTKIPAKFYDLPGTGSPNPVHDVVAKSAMADADCFLFLSHAQRSLSDDDLTRIRSLYEHYLVSRKPVLWAVTAIDTAEQLDHRDVFAWQATIDKNNAYLRDNFKRDGQPDLGFIGEGFRPVSAAWEALADRFAEQGQADTARRLAANSRMEPLRDSLRELIEQGAGVRHIAAVAAEARLAVAPHQRELEEYLQRQQYSVDELKDLLHEQDRRLRALEAQQPLIHEELENRLRNHVQRAARPFGRLAAHLHAVLDSRIRESDIRKLSVANEIQVAKTQALATWMEGPAGPGTLWAERFAAFKDEVVQVVETHLGDSDAAGRLPAYTFNVDDLTVPVPLTRRNQAQDLLQRTAALVGLGTPIVAAGGVWLTGGLTAATAFPPAAVVVGAAATAWALIQRRKNATNSLDVLRDEWIAAVDAEVEVIADQFRAAVTGQGLNVVDHLDDNLASYHEQMEQARDEVRRRIADPENRIRQELIDALRPVCEEGRAIVDGLRALERI